MSTFLIASPNTLAKLFLSDPPEFFLDPEYLQFIVRSPEIIIDYSQNMLQKPIIKKDCIPAKSSRTDDFQKPTIAVRI
jgi:hypothetical protein